MDLSSLALVYLLFSSCVLVAAQGQKFSFIAEAVTAPRSSIGEYDYIVVGGGTAGCPMAATLSQKYKVLVLERGGSPYGNPLAMRAEFFTVNLSTDLPDSPSQIFISTDGVINQRGRILGGSSSINAGFYSRAEPRFIDQLGLDKCLVEDSYRWVERVIVNIPKLGPYQSAYRTALLQAGVTPDNGVTSEHYVGTKTGGSIFDQQNNRMPSSDLLVYANASNIKVLLHATVQRVLFREGTMLAIGVEYRDGFGLTHTAFLSNNNYSEVIVTAGALGSPQLLMLSGIGPKDHLQSKGIPVLLNVPYVGRFMADNPTIRVFIPSPSPTETSLVQNVAITSFGSYLEAASGFATAPSLVDQSLLPSPAILMKGNGPASTGSLFLSTTIAGTNPTVTFNYFREPGDLEVCVGGMNVLEEAVLSDAYKRFRFDTFVLPSGGTVSSPNRRNSRYSSADINSTLANYCMQHVNTIWHYHGGCLVGKVVDADYKTLGISGLRVVDGSTFTVSPGTNPQATVMMLARYMGLKIIKERTGIPTQCISGTG